MILIDFKIAASLLTADEQAKLGEWLIKQAAKTDRDPHGLRDWASLESRIASALWNVSKLRHGMFTPPQFSDLCEQTIRQFFQSDEQKLQTPHATTHSPSYSNA